MSEYLVRWYDHGSGDEYEEQKHEEAALRRIVELHDCGLKAVLYQLVPVKLNVSARIIKRRKGTPAPAKEATPQPLPGAGDSSPEKQLSTKGAVPKCSENGCAFDADFNSEKRREHAPKKRKASGEASAASAPESAK